MIKTLYYKNGALYILEQRSLPARTHYICCRNHKDVYRAIRDMAIRGAPAIGVAAAFGMALAAHERRFTSVTALRAYLFAAKKLLASSRPTAVNLFWALERMDKTASSVLETKAIQRVLLKEAQAVYNEDISINRRIGAYGAKLLKKGSGILTHCNAGALATAGYGTALGVIRSGYKDNKIKLVFVDETRPYLQGARLTAWELCSEKIPYVLITDNMAGHFMKQGEIDAVIVGADRIAANGDTANKIGTYSLAVLAKHHKVPFYVAAPTSTIDLETGSGNKIVIEERSTAEVIYINKKTIAPCGTKAMHPAFDVTPASLITAIITENGAFKPKDIKKAK